MMVSPTFLPTCHNHPTCMPTGMPTCLFFAYKLKTKALRNHISRLCKKEGEEGESEERETQLRRLFSIEEFPHRGDCEVISIS